MEEILLSLPLADVEVIIKPVASRSRPEHNMFFALCRKAAKDWPEKTPSKFKPDNEYHLIAWLLCKVKHRTSVALPLCLNDLQIKAMTAFAISCMHAVQAKDKYAFVAEHKDSLHLLIPKSISVDELPNQSDFHRIVTTCEEYLYRETGWTWEFLKRQRAA